MANNKDKKISNLPAIYPDNNTRLVGSSAQSVGEVYMDNIKELILSNLLNRGDPAGPLKYLKPTRFGVETQLAIPIEIVDEDVISVMDTAPTTADSSEFTLVYCRPYRRLFLRETNGSYYRFWPRASSYACEWSDYCTLIERVDGASTEQVIVPVAHRLYVGSLMHDGIEFKCYFKWDGSDLVPALPTEPFTEAFDALFTTLSSHPTSSSAGAFGEIIIKPWGKVYRLNGLDLTFQEAVAVVADALRPLSPGGHNSEVIPQMQGLRGRTNFFFNFTSIDRPLFTAPHYETVRFGLPTVVSNMNKQGNIRIRCHTFIVGNNIHTIYGRLDIEYDSCDSKKKLLNCSNLENVRFKIIEGVRCVDLSGCKKLSLDSVASIVSNAPTDGYEEPVSVILHSDLIDLMQSVMEWGVVADDAWQKNIHFQDSY